MVKLLIAVLILLLALIIIRSQGVVAGPGLGYYGDYARFDKDGNFIGVEIK